jgi:hypothetical protein
VTDRTHRLHPANRLIMSLGHDPTLRERLNTNRQSLCAEFGLEAKDIAALEEGTIPALAGADVHPMYRMHWLMMSQPEAADALSVNEYIDKAKSGKSDG